MRPSIMNDWDAVADPFLSQERLSETGQGENAWGQLALTLFAREQ